MVAICGSLPLMVDSPDNLTIFDCMNPLCALLERSDFDMSNLQKKEVSRSSDAIFFSVSRGLIRRVEDVHPGALLRPIE